MRTRRLLLLTLVVGLLVAMSVPAGAAATKVDVCHFDADSGTFHLINISENAFQAHVDHGDAAPGEPVPGMLGYRFDAGCVAVLDSITVNLRQRLSTSDTYGSGAVFGSVTLDADGGMLAVDLLLNGAVPSKLLTVWVVINGLWRTVDLQKFTTDAAGNLSATLTSLTLSGYPAGAPPMVRVVVDNWYPGSAPLPYYGYASSLVSVP